LLRLCETEEPQLEHRRSRVFTDIQQLRHGVPCVFRTLGLGRNVDHLLPSPSRQEIGVENGDPCLLLFSRWLVRTHRETLAGPAPRSGDIHAPGPGEEGPAASEKLRLALLLPD
jgi:hypothetical protein